MDKIQTVYPDGSNGLNMNIRLIESLSVGQCFLYPVTTERNKAKSFRVLGRKNNAESSVFKTGVFKKTAKGLKSRIFIHIVCIQEYSFDVEFFLEDEKCMTH